MQNIKIGSGLHNLGNTCFFNAVMQVMLYTPSLLNDYNQKNHSNICKKNDWCIFCAIQKLWHQSKKSRVVMPNSIVTNLKQIFKKFRLGRQEDSHEFLRYLIEGMQDAQTGKLGKDREKNQKIITKTTTYYTFGGKIRTFVLCLNCQHKSLTTQRYYDLIMPAFEYPTIRIDDLTGSNKYRCDNCKQLVNAKKGVKIITVPSVVTFQFKRFTNSLRKIGKFIQYPKTLNLNRYMEHNEQSQKHKLQLYGVIVHSGSSAGSGHYFAFVKNGNQWFQMNDSNVSRCTQDRVLRQQAYLLFYGKPHSQKMQQKTPDTNLSQNEVVTNVKLNGNNQSVIEISHVKIEKSFQKQKQNHLKKVKEVKPFRKQNQQQFEEVKRKLSMDIQQLKQQAKGNNNKDIKDNKDNKDNKNSKNQQKLVKNKNNKSNELNNNTKIQINGKTIDAPVFGHLLLGNGVKKNEIHEAEKMKNQADDQDIDLLIPPPTLERRKSKQQVLSQMNMAQLLLTYADKIATLARKIPIRNSHRAFRSVYNLRKFEINTKRRKLEG